MKHQRKNKDHDNDRHNPWETGVPGYGWEFDNGHRGAAKARREIKMLQRRGDRNSSKLLLKKEIENADS